MFKIAQADDLSQELRETFPVPDIVAIAPGAGHSAIYLMAKMIEHDVVWQSQSARIGSEGKRQFVIMCHAHERDTVEQSVIRSLQPFITLANITAGIPPNHNFNLYVTDIEALGFNKDLINKPTLLSSNLRFARKIVYLVEQ